MPLILLYFKAAAFWFSAPFGLALFLLATIPSVVTAQTANQTAKSDQSPLSPNDPIVFLGATGYPPYGFIENSTIVGANVDLIKALGKALGRPVDLRLYNWADAQVRFNNGEGNALVIGVITAERQKLYDFTQSTFTFEFMLFYKSERLEDFANLNLSNKRIAVTRDSYPQTILENNYPEAEIVLVDNMADGFLLLSRGEVDAAIEENLVGQDHLKRTDIHGIETIETPLSTNTAHIPVHKGNSALLKELNQAISILKSSGKIKAISRKWLGGGVIFITNSEKNAATIGAAITLTIIAMLTILLFFITKKRIRERKQLENKFRSAFDHVSIGNIVINSDGVVEAFNAAAQGIFGYSADEVVGQNVKMLMPEPYVSEHDTYIKNYKDTGEPKIIGVGREVIGLRKNGEEFPMHLGVGEMITGTNRSFIGSIVDLKDQKNVEDQLRHSQRMEAVGQLTGGIAHDFNNLMQIIIGNAEVLTLKLGEDKQSQQIVATIIKAGDRASSLTDRLLAYSRKQTLIPVTSDVTGHIEGLEDMLRRTLGESIDFKFIHSTDLWPATIDPHQFENALVNLALNSRDAMTKGGTLTIETANVTLDATYAKQQDEVTPGDYVKVAVSDTGTGMSADVRERVFEPFFTTKDVGKGSGLGLSMVYGFAKQSNGHITIYSEEGHGTTVKLYMPRSLEEVAHNGTKEVNLEFAQGKERILVVEDDEDVLEISETILGDHGYEVVVAMDGKEAIKHLNDGQHFDLLFTDVVLPGGMNGIEIAKQAKQMYPNIKALYATGYAENSIVHDGKLDPESTLLNKPYRKAELLEKVRNILNADEV